MAVGQDYLSELCLNNVCSVSTPCLLCLKGEDELYGAMYHIQTFVTYLVAGDPLSLRHLCAHSPEHLISVSWLCPLLPDS